MFCEKLKVVIIPIRYQIFFLSRKETNKYFNILLKVNSKMSGCIKGRLQKRGFKKERLQKRNTVKERLLKREISKKTDYKKRESLA